eukprot:TRINITY_DN60420_c0_g1_i1.p1 TRINITY_DN60420_c0_g1~~TRINITY_DN60420_c0_g1_i1.p1  ORF type:complete len:935 (+),score=118.24 TRINITY_DN60420_c0_g1_i1:98-2902(+)
MDAGAAVAVLIALGGAFAQQPPPDAKWSVKLPDDGYTRMAMAQWGGHLYVTATDCDEHSCHNGGRTAMAALDITSGKVMGFCQLGTGDEVTATPKGVATAPVQMGDYACTVTAGGPKPMIVCFYQLYNGGSGCRHRWQGVVQDGHGPGIGGGYAGTQMTRPVVNGNMLAFTLQWPGAMAFAHVWEFNGDPTTSHRILNFGPFVTAPNDTLIGPPLLSDTIGAAARWQFTWPGRDKTRPAQLQEIPWPWSRVSGNAVGPRGGVQPVVCGMMVYFVVKDWTDAPAPTGSMDDRYMIAMDLHDGSIAWSYAFNGSDYVSIACDDKAIYVSDSSVFGVPRGALMRLLTGKVAASDRRDWFLPEAAGMNAASISAPTLGSRGDTLFVVSVSDNSQMLQSIRAEHKTLLWNRTFRTPTLSTPYVVPGVATSGSGEDAMVYLGLRSGTVVAFPDPVPPHLKPTFAPTRHPSLPPTVSPTAPTAAPSTTGPPSPPPTPAPTATPRSSSPSRLKAAQKVHSEHWVLVLSVVSSSAAFLLLLVLLLYCCWRRRGNHSRDGPASRYIIGKELGRGAFGRVHLAWKKKPPADGKKVPVAIKVIDCSHDDKRVVSALREFEIMVRVQKHPHIMTPLETSWEYDQDDTGRSKQFDDDISALPHSRRYALIVMKYYPHGDLKRFVITHKQFTADQVLDFATQLASALNFLHTLKPPLVHRDLKPENVLVRDFRDWPHLVVTDFGLAKVLERDMAQVVSTCAAPAGTLWIMSPEAFFNSYTGREIDLWSLGCVLYAVVTGRVNAPHEHARATPESAEASRVPENTYVQVLFRRAESSRDVFQYTIFREILEANQTTRVAGLIASLLSRDYEVRPTARDVLQYTAREPCARIHELWSPSGPACPAVGISPPTSSRESTLRSASTALAAALDPASLQSPSAEPLTAPLIAAE